MSKEGFDVLLSKLITVNYNYCAYICNHVQRVDIFTISTAFFQAFSFARRSLYAFEFTSHKHSNTLTSSINLSTFIIGISRYVIGERSEPPLSVELSEFSLYLASEPLSYHVN